MQTIRRNGLATTQVMHRLRLSSVWVRMFRSKVLLWVVSAGEGVLQWGGVKVVPPQLTARHSSVPACRAPCSLAGHAPVSVCVRACEWLVSRVFVHCDYWWVASFHVITYNNVFIYVNTFLMYLSIILLNLFCFYDVDNSFETCYSLQSN